MDIVTILPFISLVCFFYAVFYLRKDRVSFSQLGFPLAFSILTPNKLTSYFKKEGIILIIISIFGFFVYAFF